MRPLFLQREAKFSHVSMSSAGGSTSVLTAKSACQTCQKASESQRKEIKRPNLSNV